MMIDNITTEVRHPFWLRRFWPLWHTIIIKINYKKATSRQQSQWEVVHQGTAEYPV
jgi:hypothetical protein